MGQQVNIRCEVKYILEICILYRRKTNHVIDDKCLILDPKPGDLIIFRVIRARTGDRCKDLR